MEQLPPTPEMAWFECTACGNKQVAQVGAALLCNPCVNKFLERNVGLMQPVPVNEPGPPRAEVPPVPGIQQDGTG